LPTQVRELLVDYEPAFTAAAKQEISESLKVRRRVPLGAIPDLYDEPRFFLVKESGLVGLAKAVGPQDSMRLKAARDVPLWRSQR